MDKITGVYYNGASDVYVLDLNLGDIYARITINEKKQKFTILYDGKIRVLKLCKSNRKNIFKILGKMRYHGDMCNYHFHVYNNYILYSDGTSGILINKKQKKYTHIVIEESMEKNIKFDKDVCCFLN